MEVELKLGLDPNHMEMLRKHSLWRKLSSGRAVTQRLQSTYYDTTDHRLAAAGVTVRIRKAGKAFIQTVKTSGARHLGLFSRQEWEWSLPRDRLDEDLLRQTGLPVLQKGDVLLALHPIFATHVQRTTRQISGDDWSIELALDRGHIAAGERRLDLCEVELELQSGGTEHLFNLAQEILAIVPARLQNQSKSDLGFELSGGTTPSPSKSKPVSLRPEMNAGQGFQAIGRNCLTHLLANQRSLIECHAPESIHQMRVALRRFRSALKLFRPILIHQETEQATRDIRWLLSHLGPARDADVFLAEILHPATQDHPDNAALQLFIQQWQERRDTDFQAAILAVKDRRFTQMALTLGQWLDQATWVSEKNPPIKRHAAKMLEKYHHRLLKQGGKDLRSLPVDDRHQVRIVGKLQRYAVEFFSPLYADEATKPYLNQMARLQDELGQLNDIAVARHRLHSCDMGDDFAWAAGVIAGWHEARERDLLKSAQSAWAKFRKVPRFWA